MLDVEKQLLLFWHAWRFLGQVIRFVIIMILFFLSLFYGLLLHASTFAYPNLNELGPSVLDLHLYM